MRLNSQLIDGLSRVLQKLLISTSFVLPSAGVFPVIFILDLMIHNLLSYHLAHLCNITFLNYMFLNNYHYILLNYILVLLYQYLQHYLFLCCLFHFYN